LSKDKDKEKGKGKDKDKDRDKQGQVQVQFAGGFDSIEDPLEEEIQKTSLHSPSDNASLISWLTFSWLSPLISGTLTSVLCIL
jgi:hypothetical protein